MVDDPGINVNNDLDRVPNRVSLIRPKPCRIVEWRKTASRDILQLGQGGDGRQSYLGSEAIRASTKTATAEESRVIMAGRRLRRLRPKKWLGSSRRKPARARSSANETTAPARTQRRRLPRRLRKVGRSLASSSAPTGAIVLVGVAVIGILVVLVLTNQSPRTTRRPDRPQLATRSPSEPEPVRPGPRRIATSSVKEIATSSVKETAPNGSSWRAQKTTRRARYPEPPRKRISDISEPVSELELDEEPEPAETDPPQDDDPGSFGRGRTIVRKTNEDSTEPSADVEGYLEDLEDAFREKEGNDSLDATFRVIPDAYRYFMAKEIARLQADGYRLKDLERKVAEAHDKYKSYRGRFLLSLEVENTSGKYLFLRRGEKHLELRRKSSSRSFKVIEQVPKLRYEAWKIYETRRSGSRKVYLAEFDEQKILLLVSRFDLESQEPFTLTLRNVVAHKKTDEVAGFNDHSRQMSSDQFRDFLVPAVSFLVSPARVKHPQPPSDFNELLSGLE